MYGLKCVLWVDVPCMWACLFRSVLIVSLQVRVGWWGLCCGEYNRKVSEKENFIFLVEVLVTPSETLSMVNELQQVVLGGVGRR